MTENNNGSRWFQDNLRIIISIGIVVLLVFAIYSYSKRNNPAEVIVDDTQEVTDIAKVDEENDTVQEIIDEIKDDTVTQTVDTTVETQPAADDVVEESTEDTADMHEVAEAEEQKQPSQQEEEKQEEEQQPEEMQSAEDIVREVIESHPTTHPTMIDGVVKVTAVRGDSMTTLARKATSEYITKNHTEGLTGAHKIYIEDYLRRKHPMQRVLVNTEMSFTEAEIAEAISHAQKLSDGQIKNLARYAQNVPQL
ncbi:MAG: hypothetical protein CR954_00990 [Candidatus Moraniibacteriota bacterium]|nr:MAG: hypothetical protein CR954_00990 [Candidatus Moranbacteria bacterium]